MKTAIYSLCQANEFEYALNQYQMFRHEVDDYVVLLNDKVDNATLSNFKSEFGQDLIYFGRNLGISSGRQYLTNYLRNKRLAQLLISIDNDLVFEEGFFTRLKKQYIDLLSVKPNLGICQPVLLNGSSQNVLGFYQALTRNRSIDTDTRSFNEFFLNSCADPDMFHIGIKDLFKAHFGANIAENEVQDIISLDIEHSKSDYVRYRYSDIVEAIKSGISLKLATCPGGMCIYRAELLDSIEFIKEFDPFGYEDSFFCFKSLLAGFQNYLLPSLICIHDLQDSPGRSKVPLYNSRIARLRAIELAEFEKLSSSLFFKLLLASLFFQTGHPNEDIANLINLCHGLLSFIRPGQSPYLLDSNGFVKVDLGEFSITVSNMLLIIDRDNDSNQTLAIVLQGLKIIRKVDCKLLLQESDVTVRSLLPSHHGNKGDCIAERVKSFFISFEIFDNSYTSSVEYACDYILDPFNNYVSCVLDLIVDFGSVKNEYGEFGTELDLADDSIVSRSVDVSNNAMVVSLQATHLSSQLLLPMFPDISIKKIRDSYNHRVLFYADSRGQHIPSGAKHKSLGSSLFEKFTCIETFECPYKWTTLVDLFSGPFDNKIDSCDTLIIYAGIVDWSPRPASQIFNQLMNPEFEVNTDNQYLNTTSYSNKVVNKKIEGFTKIFGREFVDSSLKRKFEAEFMGEYTSNLYPLEGLLTLAKIINTLKCNVIFINCNSMASGWSGDYPRSRPSNMNIIAPYSHLAKWLFNKAFIIDLTRWSECQVKTFTCDNLHLTSKGISYIEQKIISAFHIMSERQLLPQGVMSTYLLNMKTALNNKNYEEFIRFGTLLWDNGFTSSRNYMYFANKEKDWPIPSGAFGIM